MGLSKEASRLKIWLESQGFSPGQVLQAVNLIQSAEKQAAVTAIEHAISLISRLQADPESFSQIVKDLNFAESMRKNIVAVHVPIRTEDEQAEQLAATLYNPSGAEAG